MFHTPANARIAADQAGLAPARLQPDVGGVRGDGVSAQTSDNNLHAIINPSQNPTLMKSEMIKGQSKSLQGAFEWAWIQDPPVSWFCWKLDSEG